MDVAHADDGTEIEFTIEVREQLAIARALPALLSAVPILPVPVPKALSSWNEVVVGLNLATWWSPQIAT